jgi:hypothetical protein
MTKNKSARKVVTWAAALSSVFIMVVGAVLVTFIVGDWLYIHTQDSAIVWVIVGVLVLGFLLTLGGGIGLWTTLRDSPGLSEEKARQILEDTILEKLDLIHKD